MTPEERRIAENYVEGTRGRLQKLKAMRAEAEGDEALARKLDASIVELERRIAETVSDLGSN